MPNKTFNDFTPRSPSTAGWPSNNDLTTSSHKIVGYSSTTAGGEYSMALNDFHYGMPGICKAWLTCSFRAQLGVNADLPQPRIIQAYNIASIVTSQRDRDADKVFEVIFTRPFTSRRYAVVCGDAGRGSSYFEPTVRAFSSTSYKDIPSETQYGIYPYTDQRWSWKAVDRCRLYSVSDKSSEVYYVFFGT